MKACILVVGLVLVVVSPLASQTQQGSWEMSMTATFASISETMSSGGSSSTSDAQGYVVVGVRPAIYVIDGLSIEPEFLWTAIENLPPVFSISGNLSYTVSLEESKNFKPFVLAGYGVGNGVPLARMLFFRQSDALDISLLNLGAGVKAFFSEAFALRAEYRYQRHGYTTSGGTDITWNTHNIFLGFSVFFGP